MSENPVDQPDRDVERIAARLDRLAARERDAAGPEFERRLVEAVTASGPAPALRVVEPRGARPVVRSIRWLAPLALAAAVVLASVLWFLPSAPTSSPSPDPGVEEAAWADSLLDHLEHPFDPALESDLGVLAADLTLLEADPLHATVDDDNLALEDLIQ